MRSRSVWKYTRPLCAAVLITLTGLSSAWAANPSSSNYQLSESSFNSGTLDGCSGSYCARASIGDVGGGASNSTNSTASFGSVTPDEPSLDVIVSQGASDLGVLTTTRTASTTMSVQVRNYLSNGYTMQITGTSPKYNGHYLATPSTPAASSMGTEQFGINAVANTSPSVGAAPVQVPDSGFSFGVVNSNYATANQFMYASGDTVAHSNSQSGQTSYTISMIINIANNTPAGHYSGDFSAVVIPVY